MSSLTLRICEPVNVRIESNPGKSIHQIRRICVDCNLVIGSYYPLLTTMSPCNLRCLLIVLTLFRDLPSKKFLVGRNFHHAYNPPMDFPQLLICAPSARHPRLVCARRFFRARRAQARLTFPPFLVYVFVVATFSLCPLSSMSQPERSSSRQIPRTASHPNWIQQNEADGAMTSSPGDTADEITPEKGTAEQKNLTPPCVVHPSVQRPPLPIPPKYLALPVINTKPPASAAWRATALSLLAGRKLERPSMTRTFDAVYGDTLLAILGACWRSGLKVEALNSNSGEILTTLPNSNIRLVVTLAEVSAGKTKVAAGCHTGTGEAARLAIETLLQTCAETLTKQERI